MKTTFLLLSVVAVSLGMARAQDADYSDSSNYQPADAPAVVYQAPVVYTAPVVYQAPVVYYAPVYYGVPTTSALNTGAACEDNSVRSTVTYIGGGQTRFQVSPRCNNGSTVVFIGGQSRFH